jgi:hypothetical protein
MPIYGFKRIYKIESELYLEAPDQATADARERAMSDFTFYDYSSHDNPEQQGDTRSLGEMEDISYADLDEQYFEELAEEEDEEEEGE